jgi:hypothetical protein
MNIRSLVAISVLGVFSFSLLSNSANNTVVSVWVSCEGTVVSRTSVGKLELSRIEPNSPRCQGPKYTGKIVSTSSSVNSGTLSTVSQDANEVDLEYTQPRDVILFDLKQTDIVNYRLERMRQNQIRYANAIRSVRMRQAKSTASKTTAYLIKNDAVITNGDESGWVETQWITLDLLDPVENTLVADTTNKASGYIPAKYLREANPSDLVRIRQADNAYWSDIAHVNAERYLNVRAHPWFTAPIVTTIGRDTVLYVVSTVDDWSEVITDDRSIQGYVKSKYLTIDKAQREEQSPLLK